MSKEDSSTKQKKRFNLKLRKTKKNKSEHEESSKEIDSEEFEWDHSGDLESPEKNEEDIIDYLLDIESENLVQDRPRSRICCWAQQYVNR